MAARRTKTLPIGPVELDEEVRVTLTADGELDFETTDYERPGFYLENAAVSRLRDFLDLVENSLFIENTSLMVHGWGVIPPGESMIVTADKLEGDRA